MKKIWMIEQQSRVKGTKEWTRTAPVYAYTTKDAAQNDEKYKRLSPEDDGYLEYKYIITEYELYDE